VLHTIDGDAVPTWIISLVYILPPGGGGGSMITNGVIRFMLRCDTWSDLVSNCTKLYITCQNRRYFTIYVI
jgi:hypothetical protein